MLRTEEVRIYLEEVLQLFPLLVSCSLQVAHIILDKGQIALRYHLFGPVYCRRQRVYHLKEGMIERFLTFQALVDQVYDQCVVISVVVGDKQGFMVFKKMPDWRIPRMFCRDDTLVRNVEQGLVAAYIFFDSGA